MMPVSYRHSLEIVEHVLQAADESGSVGINLTSLLRKANLSYTRLGKIAANLLEAGLMDEQIQAGQRIYVITSKGKDYLTKYRQFAELADSFGLQL